MLISRGFKLTVLDYRTLSVYLTTYCSIRSIILFVSSPRRSLDHGVRQNKMYKADHIKKKSLYRDEKTGLEPLKSATTNES